MGVVYNCNCSNCGYEKRFSLGGGLLGFNINKNIRFLAKNEQKELQLMIDRNEVESFFVENRLSLCSVCENGDLKAEVVIVVIGTDGKERVFGTFCRECGSKLILHSEEEVKSGSMECPVCRNEGLSFETVGFWD